MIDAYGILYCDDDANMPDRRRVVVPQHLAIREHYNNPYSVHFAVERMNK